MDVEHNVLIVDRAHPTHMYVGADIGVWHSSDGGLNWAPFQNGLPDAPVYDLQIPPRSDCCGRHRTGVAL
jgi:hypothetical protein